jgi:hypothetical protein
MELKTFESEDKNDWRFLYQIAKLLKNYWKENNEAEKEKEKVN